MCASEETKSTHTEHTRHVFYVQRNKAGQYKVVVSIRRELHSYHGSFH
jgi:hypothetical protein